MHRGLRFGLLLLSVFRYRVAWKKRWTLVVSKHFLKKPPAMRLEQKMSHQRHHATPCLLAHRPKMQPVKKKHCNMVLNTKGKENWKKSKSNLSNLNILITC